MTNKEIAAAVNVAVQTGNPDGIEPIVRKDYIQHTPVVADGLAGLKALITKIKNKEIPAPKITTIRSFEDDDYMVLHHDVYWPNRKVMLEIFRYEDGMAVEHWSGLAEQPETTANGHTMTDGETTVSDKNLTEVNKLLAKDFVETVLIKGKFDRIDNYYHENIIQHNPYIDNTIQGLISGVQELQSKGLTIEIEKIVKVLGEGNFALVCSEGKFAGKPTAFFDLFRISAGKVAEHWDVIQTIPEKSANGNSFF